MTDGDGGLPGASTSGLTPRQLEILELVAKGLSNLDICELLCISRNTVKVHVAAVLRTLNVANRTEAASAYQALLHAQDAAAVKARVIRDVGRPAIAVLPFVNLSEAEDGDHLAAGLVDDLITRLSGWRWFPVIASTSTSRYAVEPDLAIVRRELRASYAITGSVRLLDRRIRVSAQLLETERGQGLWAGSFDARLEDLFATQDEIARRIVASLAPELMELEGQRVPAAADRDFGVWRLTMQGMWHLARRSRDDVARARELFDCAIAADRTFSFAWFGLTWVHHHNLIEQWTDEPEAEREGLERAAAECLRLDAVGAHGQTVAGLVQMLRGSREGAVNHLERAVRLNPSSIQALSLLGQCYGLSGRPDECIAMLEEALELNPFSPTLWSYQGVIALAHFAVGRWDDAIAWSNKALNGRPEMVTAHLTLCASLVERGDVAAASRVLAQLGERRPGFAVADFIALIAPAARPEYIERLRAALAAAAAA